MPSLHNIREARSIARDSVRSNLSALQFLLKENASPQIMGLISSLDGDIHELDLLHRREVEIISTGRDLNQHD